MHAGHGHTSSRHSPQGQSRTLERNKVLHTIRVLNGKYNRNYIDSLSYFQKQAKRSPGFRIAAVAKQMLPHVDFSDTRSHHGVIDLIQVGAYADTAESCDDAQPTYESFVADHIEQGYSYCYASDGPFMRCQYTKQPFDTIRVSIGATVSAHLLLTEGCRTGEKNTHLLNLQHTIPLANILVAMRPVYVSEVPLLFLVSHVPDVVRDDFGELVPGSGTQTRRFLAARVVDTKMRLSPDTVIAMRRKTQ